MVVDEGEVNKEQNFDLVRIKRALEAIRQEQIKMKEPPPDRK